MEKKDATKHSFRKLLPWMRQPTNRPFCKVKDLKTECSTKKVIECDSYSESVQAGAEKNAAVASKAAASWWQPKGVLSAQDTRTKLPGF